VVPSLYDLSEALERRKNSILEFRISGKETTRSRLGCSILGFDGVRPRYVPAVSLFSCHKTVFTGVSASFSPTNLPV